MRFDLCPDHPLQSVAGKPSDPTTRKKAERPSRRSLRSPFAADGPVITEEMVRQMRDTLMSSRPVDPEPPDTLSQWTHSDGPGGGDIHIQGARMVIDSDELHPISDSPSIGVAVRVPEYSDPPPPLTSP
jgi:hypothetical protein